MSLRLSNETAPVGNWAQIKVFASAPANIASASIFMDLDPSIFANTSRVMVFSGSGDAIGYADVSPLHIYVSVSSASGSIGSDPAVPILAIWTDIFVGAQIGSSAVLTIDPSKTSLSSKQGQYAVTVAPGQLAVRGSLSVHDVLPGGGIVGPGSIVRITGSGFDPATTVTIDGVKLASTNWISRSEIDATVDSSSGPVEMTGRRVHVANAGGEAVDYFASLPSGYPGFYQWILPLTTFSVASFAPLVEIHGGVGQGVLLLNVNSTPVTVELVNTLNPGFGGPGGVFSQQTVTIPPWTFSSAGMIANGPGTVSIAASARIRVLGVTSVPLLPPATGTFIGFSRPSATNTFPPIQSLISSSSISWSSASGSQPFPAEVQIGGDLPFTASADQPWLAITPSSGTAPATLTIAPKLAGLAPGSYSATVSVTPILPANLPNLTAAPATIKVSLIVSSGPLISADAVSWDATGPGFFTNPVTTWVSTNGGPAPFKVIVPPESSGWLTVSPLNGVAPMPLTFTYIGGPTPPAALAHIQYSASVLVEGSNNTMTLPVSFTSGFPAAVVPAAAFTPIPPGVSFLLSSAPGTSETKSVKVAALTSLQASVQTQNGGSWLTTAFVDSSQGPLNITANTANLAPGAYYGTVTVTALGLSGSVQIPVDLAVYDPPLPQTVLSATVSGSTITVTSSDIPVYFTAEGASESPGSYDGNIPYARNPSVRNLAQTSARQL